MHRYSMQRRKGYERRTKIRDRGRNEVIERMRMGGKHKLEFRREGEVSTNQWWRERQKLTYKEKTLREVGFMTGKK